MASIMTKPLTATALLIVMVTACSSVPPKQEAAHNRASIHPLAQFSENTPSSDRYRNAR